MRINLQGKNMDLTGPISDYVEKRVTNLGRLLAKMEERNGEVAIHFEVEKTTNHHKSGEIFRASSSIHIGGQAFHASADKPDLYEAIDEVKEILFREVGKAKDRKQTLFKRGASKIKNALKGMANFGKRK